MLLLVRGLGGDGGAGEMGIATDTSGLLLETSGGVEVGRGLDMGSLVAVLVGFAQYKVALVTTEGLTLRDSMRQEMEEVEREGSRRESGGGWGR